MLADPIRGAGYFLRGFSLMSRPGIRTFVAIPLVVNILLFSAMIWWASSEFSALVDKYTPELPSWLGWLESLIWLLFALVAAVVVLFSFSILANLIAAPFNGPLAAAVERHLTGQSADDGGSLLDALKDVLPALIDEVRKLLYFALLAIPLLILTLIPVLQLATPILWPLLGAWMLALEYNDYPMGNHGIKFADQRQRIRQRRLLNLGFGGTTLTATLIPVLNFLVMPAAVCGATAMWVEVTSQSDTAQ